MVLSLLLTITILKFYSVQNGIYPTLSRPLPDHSARGRPYISFSDWLQRAIDDPAYAVEVGLLSEEGRLALAAHTHREQLLQELESEKGRQNGRREETEQYSPS